MVSLERYLPNLDEIPLVTRARRQIPNRFGDLQLPIESMDAFVDGVKDRWPNLKRRSARSTYNCFGMVFADRRTTVREEALRLIYRDDGYRTITRPEAMPGDVAVYRSRNGDIQHVGVVLRQRAVKNDEDELEIVSQWGLNGEFIHWANEVPDAYGKLTELWTERTP